MNITISLRIAGSPKRSIALLKRLLARSCFQDVQIELGKDAS